MEATFRSLKSELGLRPIWHHLDRRVSTHLFVAVLAYPAVHLVRTRLKARGVHLSWQSIRDRLANWVRVTTTVQSADGQPVCSRQDVRPGSGRLRDRPSGRIGAEGASPADPQGGLTNSHKM